MSTTNDTRPEFKGEMPRGEDSRGSHVGVSTSVYRNPSVYIHRVGDEHVAASIGGVSLVFTPEEWRYLIASVSEVLPAEVTA